MPSQRLFDTQGSPGGSYAPRQAPPPQPTQPWWASRTVNKYADFEDLIAGAGSLDNAGQQVDAVRTNHGDGMLPGLAPEDRSQFDRYVHGAQLDEQNPGLAGAVTKAVSIPVAGAYELAKNYPPLLNAAARIPGLESLAVDDTTSPPSLDNYLAFTTGAFRGLGQSVDKMLQRRSRRIDPNGE